MSYYHVARAFVLNGFPGEKVKSQSLRDWLGPFELPTDLECYYLDFGPMDLELNLGSETFYFPSLKKLWRYQSQFGFNSRRRASRVGWHPDWLAIADDGKRVVIYDRASGTVLLDSQPYDSERWQPQRLCKDLETMLKVLCVFSSACENYRGRFTGSHNPKSGMHSSNAKELAYLNLVELTGDLNAANNIMSAFGWQVA